MPSSQKCSQLVEIGRTDRALRTRPALLAFALALVWTLDPHRHRVSKSPQPSFVALRNW